MLGSAAGVDEALAAGSVVAGPGAGDGETADGPCADAGLAAGRVDAGFDGDGGSGGDDAYYLILGVGAPHHRFFQYIQYVRGPDRVVWSVRVGMWRGTGGWVRSVRPGMKMCVRRET